MYILFGDNDHFAGKREISRQNRLPLIWHEYKMGLCNALTGKPNGFCVKEILNIRVERARKIGEEFLGPFLSNPLQKFF